MTDLPYVVRPAEHPEDDAAREARHQLLATLLAAYADGELPVETASQIDAHLLGCGRCRSELRVQRMVGDRLARSSVPTATAAFQSRIRAAVATAPVPASAVPNDAPRPVWARRLLVMLGMAVLATAIGMWSWQRDPAPQLDPPPIVVRSSMPAFTSIIGDYRRVAQGDLPGRARDLDAVRSALPFPLTPITHPDAHLLAAWTAELDGEPAAVLAYRWNERVVLQYVVAEAALFRAREVREALAERRLVVGQEGTLGFVAWPEASAGSVLVGDVSWQALVALRIPAVH